jgi:cell division protease FtsH
MHLNSTVKQILIWVFMITCLICLWQFVVKGAGMGQDRTDSLTQFMNDADQGKIADVVVNGSEVTGHYRDEKGQFHVTIPANGYQDMYKTLRELLGLHIDLDRALRPPARPLVLPPAPNAVRRQ